MLFLKKCWGTFRDFKENEEWLDQSGPPLLFGSVRRIDLEPEKSPEEAPDLRSAPSAGLVAGEGIGAEAQGTWTSVDATEEDSLGTGGWHCP